MITLWYHVCVCVCVCREYTTLFNPSIQCTVPAAGYIYLTKGRSNVMRWEPAASEPATNCQTERTAYSCMYVDAYMYIHGGGNVCIVSICG